EQAAAFSVPATLDVEIIRLDPAAMGDPSSITDEELRAAYDVRINRYTEAEKIRASHILIRVDANASDSAVKKAEEEIKALEARLRGGEDFAEVAKAHGQDGSAQQGGDLGWFTDGQMVPEFSKAAFALKDGELSAPVRTQFGFHLIKKVGHEAAKVRSFDEVKDSLRAELATENAGRGLEEKADSVLAQALAGKTFEEAAKVASGVKVETISGLTAADIAEKLGVRDSDAKNIMAVAAGTVIDTPVPSGASLLILKVVNSKPESVKPLDEVRPTIIEFLKHNKAADLAMDEARKARAAFKDGKPSADMVVKTSESFGRDGNITDLVADAALAQAAFSAGQVNGTWFEEPYRVQDGAVLAVLSKVESPSDEEWKQAEPEVMARMQNDRAGMIYQTYIEQLAAQAEVKFFNSPLLEKLNKK
ncbi:MAG: peptidylprolyl isomerase, partial [Mailhella sp.]|nr:peptidylprolyl isomerase [Mailhella sp.]